MPHDRRPAPATLEHAPDHLLADGAADGDRRAFAALIRRYGPLLRDYTSRTVGHGTSDHIVQQTFLTAWHRLDSLTEPADVGHG